MKICLASHNQHKVKELNNMLSGHYEEVVGLHDLGIHEEIAETGSTLEENSRIKAMFVFDRYQIPTIADDSGLLVDALNGAPGVFSARYAGPEKNDEKNIDLLLKNLGDSKNRRAEFKTVITFIDAKGKESQFLGVIEGEILTEKRGANGFGYDPVFQPKGHHLTFAELTSEIKNRISHRADAVRQLINYLTNIDE